MGALRLYRSATESWGVLIAADPFCPARVDSGGPVVGQTVPSRSRIWEVDEIETFSQSRSPASNHPEGIITQLLSDGRVRSSRLKLDYQFRAFLYGT